MLLKNVALAFAALALTTGSAFADDLIEDLGKMDAAAITDAGVEVEEPALDGLDVEGMTEEAGADTDAVEACFRRFGGYGNHGWNQWCGYRSYNHCYNNFYNSCYSYGYTYSQPVYCYRPIVSCYTHCLPVVTSYWGCY